MAKSHAKRQLETDDKGQQGHYDHHERGSTHHLTADPLFKPEDDWMHRPAQRFPVEVISEERSPLQSAELLHRHPDETISKAHERFVVTRRQPVHGHDRAGGMFQEVIQDDATLHGNGALQELPDRLLAQEPERQHVPRGESFDTITRHRRPTGSGRNT